MGGVEVSMSGGERGGGMGPFFGREFYVAVWQSEGGDFVFKEVFRGRVRQK